HVGRDFSSLDSQERGLHPGDPRTCPVFPFTKPRACSFTRPLLTSFMLTLPHTAPAAGENRALPVRSILGWVSPLPELQYAGESVGPPRCHLARAAARALLAVIGVEAQHGRRLATIQDGLRDVGRA